jgi:hypothetical protein
MSPCQLGPEVVARTALPGKAGGKVEDAFPANETVVVAFGQVSSH